MPRTCPGGGARTCPGGGARSARASAPRAHPLTPTSRSLTLARPARAHAPTEFSAIRGFERQTGASQKSFLGFLPKLPRMGRRWGKISEAQAVASNWSHSRRLAHVATRAQGSQGSKGPSARTLRCCPVQQPFWQLPLRDRAPHRCCQSWKEARGTLLWTVLPHS